MTARDIRTVIPLPTGAILRSMYDAAQMWLLHLPADYYMPVPLRHLREDILQCLLLDPQAGIRLDHGVALRVGEQWFYHYQLTLGLAGHGPVIVKSLNVSLPALYSDFPMSLAELEAALRLLVIAGTAESSPAVTTGVVAKDIEWGWRVVFYTDRDQRAGSFPLASWARRQHGEWSFWQGLRRTVGTVRSAHEEDR